MEIDAYELRKRLSEEAASIANAMLQGVATWEEYQQLVGRARGIAASMEIAEEMERRTGATEG
ncbi:hypothetical protein [Planktothrix phage Pra-JY27]|nr:hypothetical protein [Planktothrix phage Pag-Yong1]WEV89286.1 hypothetical protein [Synechococcus phage MinM2]